MYTVAADMRPAGGRVRPAQCCQPLTSDLSDVLNTDLYQLVISKENAADHKTLIDTGDLLLICDTWRKSDYD